MHLQFDEAKHEYQLAYEGASIRLPSVTEILSYFQIGPQYPVGDYRVRGKNVHRVCEAWDKGEEIERVGEVIAPYLESYKLAMAEWDFEWSGIEIRGYHPTLGYAGTIDRFGKRRSRNKFCVADIKSGDTDEKETGLQTAGYAGLITACSDLKYLAGPCSVQDIERYRIRLFKDGKRADVVEYKKQGAWEAFSGAVQLYKFVK